MIIRISDVLCRLVLGALMVVVPVLMTTLVTAPVAMAGVLERLAEDGVLRAGTRADAAPFAMRGADGAFSGLSVDLLEAIRAATEAKLGRSITLEISPVTPADRLERVASGGLDIVCGITTPTRQREDQVDFSLPFFRDGTRILVYRDALASGPSLAVMTIAVAQSTTTEAVIAEALPGATIRRFPDMRAAMEALAAGTVDGVANLGVVLLGLLREREPERSVVLLPRTRSLNTEPMACVLPENDSAWRDMVNGVLVDLFAGIGEFRGDYVALYERWFGRAGLMHYPLNRETRDYLSAIRPWAN